MSSSYTLDFNTMQQVMQAHKQTGRLYAEARVEKLRRICQIEVSLSAGVITSCEIKAGNRSLVGQEAAQELAHLGRIRWTFTPQQAATPMGLAPPIVPAESLFYPQRVVHLERWQTKNWPRLHWAVFSLADGTKSISTVAAMLAVPTEVVNKILHDLESIDVIALRQKDTYI